MGWDDSDDDWEKEDLKLDLGAKPKDEEWSDEEGHDAHLKEEAPKVQAPKPQASKELTGLALKIAEREKKEAEEAERKAALRKELGHDDAALDVSDVDAATAEKIRRKHMEEASDLDAAIDAFGVSAAKKPAAAPAAGSKAAAAPKPAAAPAPAVSKEDAARVAAREAAALGGVSMEEFEAKSDAEFEKLAKLINAKLAPSEGKKGHMVCLKALLRLATANMDTEQCKELASFTTVLSNDKIKAEREKDKKKTTGKKKGKINIAANKGTDFDDIGLDNSGGGRGWSGGGGGRDDDYDFM